MQNRKISWSHFRKNDEISRKTSDRLFCNTLPITFSVRFVLVSKLIFVSQFDCYVTFRTTFAFVLFRNDMCQTFAQLLRLFYSKIIYINRCGSLEAAGNNNLSKIYQKNAELNKLSKKNAETLLLKFFADHLCSLLQICVGIYTNYSKNPNSTRPSVRKFSFATNLGTKLRRIRRKLNSKSRIKNV